MGLLAISYVIMRLIVYLTGVLAYYFLYKVWKFFRGRAVSYRDVTRLATHRFESPLEPTARVPPDRGG